MNNYFENTTGEKFTTVDKSEFIVYRYDGGQYGICRNDGIGSDCVFGGDSGSEEDYNEEYIQEVYNEWNGDLVDMNDYGWRIEL